MKLDWLEVYNVMEALRLEPFGGCFWLMLAWFGARVNRGES